MIFLASIMAIISSFFLLQDIMSSIKKDVIADLNSNNTQNRSQENPLQAQLEQMEQEKADLQAKLEALKKKNEFTPGKVFQDRLQDGSLGPKMVWIPPGSFRMGDIQGGGDSDEKPVHEVSADKFAMGKYEVTVGEFRKFVNATGYQTDAEKQNSCWTYKDGSWNDQKGANWRNSNFSQNDNNPVLCVSWNDATAYAEWLSNQTGKQYRLPTETEWEYAARAGTTTKYWWDNETGQNRANCWASECGDSFKYTAPVGSFSANKFGLYDTAGNVSEWTCSLYENQYNGKEKQCVTTGYLLSVRGGSWSFGAWWVRSADRSVGWPTARNDYLGFRVSRL